METTINPAPVQQTERPQYETPRVQVMSEREILNTFQITQSMCGWWATGGC
jgi:hypothetical protein